VLNDPDEIVIDFSESRVVDMSGIEALNKLTERYLKVGKKLHLKRLSVDCKQLLQNADEIIEVNIMEDPTYKVLLNRNIGK
jgi:sulfate permease, SulP family